MHLVQGIRETTSLQMAQVTFGKSHWIDHTKLTVFVDCYACDQSIGGNETKAGKISDDAFSELVHQRGWTDVEGKAWLCPTCSPRRAELSMKGANP